MTFASSTIHYFRNNDTFKNLVEVMETFKTYSDWSVMHFAAYFFFDVDIENSPLETLTDCDNSFQTSVIHVAASSGNTDFILRLLAKLSDVFVRDLNLSTVMHYAVAGTPETVATLIQMPAFFEQLHYRDQNGYTPIDIACASSKADILRTFLVHGVTVKMLTGYVHNKQKHPQFGKCSVLFFYEDCTPYFKFNPNELVNDFDTHSIQFGGGPLHWIDDWSAMDQVFKANVFYIHNRNKLGETPLISFVKRVGLFVPLDVSISSEVELNEDLEPMFEQSVITMKHLKSTTNSISHSRDRLGWILRYLKSKADVNSKDNKGNTALHYAVLNCDIPVVQLLIIFGATSNVANEKGETPLNLASMRMREVAAIYEKLRKSPKSSRSSRERTTRSLLRTDQVNTLAKNYEELVILLKSICYSNIQQRRRRSSSLSVDSCDSFGQKISIIVLNELTTFLMKKMGYNRFSIDSFGSFSTAECSSAPSNIPSYDSSTPVVKANDQLPRILCLDGGMNNACLESLIQCMILDELGKYLASPIQNHFSIMTGSGFGGITAAMLATKRSPLHIFNFFLYLREQMNKSNADLVLEKLLLKEFGENLTLEQVNDNYRCQLVVHAIQVDLQPPALVQMSPFSKYGSWKLWEVCRATGSGLSIHTCYKNHYDASVTATNPTVDSLSYYYRQAGSELFSKSSSTSFRTKSPLPLGTVVSVGSGFERPTPFTQKELDDMNPNPIKLIMWEWHKNIAYFRSLRDIMLGVMTDANNIANERYRSKVFENY